MPFPSGGCGCGCGAGSFFMNGGASTPPNTTAYNWPQDGTAVNQPVISLDGSIIIPRVSTLKNLYAAIDVGPGVDETVTCTIFVNGLATALMVQFTGAGTFQSDIVDTVVLAINDFMTIEIISSLGSITNQITWGFEVGP